MSVKPPSESDALPPWPEEIERTKLPDYLQENPVMKLFLSLPQERKAMLGELAERTAIEDGETTRQPVAKLL